jgi:pimeloyl-ACP methyl ester carboxylesterase
MADWTEHTVTANGIEQHYWQLGSRPQLLVLHGFTDSGRCWQRLADALEGEYDLIAPDARGHGLSGTPETGYRPEDRVADALGLLDALGIDKIVVMGHSMGAQTAALLTATAPERVRAAILEDPPFRDDLRAPRGLQDWAAAQREKQALTRDQLIAWAQQNLRTWSPDTFEPWAEAQQQVRMVAFEYGTAPTVAWRDYIGNIQAPTLLITGEPERGAIVEPTLAAELEASLPSLRVAHIAGAGHCVRYEQFDAYLAAVRGFLREVAA